MSDLKLVTKVQPGQEPQPLVTGTSEYFGEQSNDLQLDTNNDFAVLSGVEKLKQDINKILLTSLGANPNFEIYGSELQNLVGNKMRYEFIQSKIKDEIITALRTLQFANEYNPNLNEQIDTLRTLEFLQPQPDLVKVEMTVVTVAGTIVDTGLTVYI